MYKNNILIVAIVLVVCLLLVGLFHFGCGRTIPPGTTPTTSTSTSTSTTSSTSIVSTTVTTTSTTSTSETTTTSTSSTTTSTLAVGSALFCYVHGDPSSHATPESHLVAVRNICPVSGVGTAEAFWGYCYYNGITMEVHVVKADGSYDGLAINPEVIQNFYNKFWMVFAYTLEGWVIDSTSAMTIARNHPFVQTWEASIAGHTIDRWAYINMPQSTIYPIWTVDLIDLSGSPRICTEITLNGSDGTILLVQQSQI